MSESTKEAENEDYAKEVTDSIDALISGGTNSYNDQVATSLGALSVKDMSDAELFRLIREKEQQKQREKYEKYLKKQASSAADRDHKFWDTQPVPRLTDEVVEENGPIDANTDITQVKQDPYNMPPGFEWCSLDVNDTNQLQEMYHLLTENYVEDDDCNFRFDYSPEFLKWALTPPGYYSDLHVGVRATKSKALMGCITAVPADIRVHGSLQPMVEVNFLCVHKKLRTKRLAPVLIKEVTRRVHLHGRWQATYTAGVVLPKPIGRCHYHHRSLNPKKLIEIKFSSLPQRTTMAKHLKDLKLPDTPAHSFEPVKVEDMSTIHELLTNSLSQSKFHQVFTVEELTHILMTRPNVISTYVCRNTHGKVTDFCSFYHLPSTVINNPKHNKLNAVYSYYHVATTMTFLELMTDCLVLAKLEDADVFNALDLLDNLSVFEPLKFGQGDGYLQYYLYNWKCQFIPPHDIGLVLL